MKEFNESSNKEQTGIHSEIFRKNFSFQRSSEMLKPVYNAYTMIQVNAIKNELSDLKGL